MALCAGALRRYLVEHAALPDKGLAVGVPASIRPPGNAQLNNQVVFTLSRLPTEVAEPLPRLAAAQAAGQEAKNLFADMRDLLTTDISIVAAPLVVMGLTRLWAAARGANYLWPFFNLVISNVPGPRQPLYCVGAPATHYFPISIPYHGCALNVTVQSYLDQLDFGLIACRETVPDAQRIADFIVEDFAALKAADAELDEARRRRQDRRGARAEAGRSGKTGPARRAEAARRRRAPPKPEKKSDLAREIDALGGATAVRKRRLEAKAETPEQPRPEPAEKNRRPQRPRPGRSGRRGGRPRRRRRRRPRRRPDRAGSPRRRRRRRAERPARAAGRKA